MRTIIAQKGDRLDQIVYKEYGTLTIFDKVLEANTHLATKPILSDGDVVNIPVIQIKRQTTKEVKSLW